MEQFEAEHRRLADAGKYPVLSCKYAAGVHSCLISHSCFHPLRRTYDIFRIRPLSAALVCGSLLPLWLCSDAYGNVGTGGNGNVPVLAFVAVLPNSR